MSRPPLLVDVAELLRHPGERRPIERSVPLGPVGTSTAQVEADVPVDVEVVLESITGSSVVVEGTVAAPWTATCRRCLEPVEGQLESPVREVFEPHATEGETYPLVQGEIDLEPLVRDAVLLGLPLAPLCRPDCPGPDPGDYPVVAAEDTADSSAVAGPRPLDPRWAALDQLELGEN